MNHELVSTHRYSLPTLLLLCFVALFISACDKKADDSGGSQTAGTEPEEQADESKQPADDAATQSPPDNGKAPAKLVVSQSRFLKKNGKLVPGPATVDLLTPGDDLWPSETLEDPASNVFHKAVPWREGLLTIGASKARLVHWIPGGDGWKSTVLWEQSWGGKFDRLRDIEIGDVNGDGNDELVIGTHDQGVVAVGSESNGEWTFVEMDKTPDTFVHEVEIGDVDGDEKLEFYVSVSGRNRTDQTSQPGGVYRYDFTGDSYERSEVVVWKDTHAKEILVTDIDGEGGDELFVAREAHTERKDGQKRPVIVDPVQILEMSPGDEGWSEVARLEIQDQQLRFLVPGDIDGDGDKEIVASAMTSGVWRVERDGNELSKELIDADSGGFEHATLVADMDGDRTPEIYVAADQQRELRQYTWNGTFERKTIGETEPGSITWSLSVLPGD